MARKRERHRQPPQGRGIPAGQVPVIDPEAQQRAQAQAEAQIRARVEGVAAQIFTDVAAEVIRVVGPDDNDKLEASLTDAASVSIDAALVLGRELWGVQAQRQKPAQPPKRRPRVITEDDDDGGDDNEE